MPFKQYSPHVSLRCCLAPRISHPHYMRAFRGPVILYRSRVVVGVRIAGCASMFSGVSRLFLVIKSRGSFLACILGWDGISAHVRTLRRAAIAYFGDFSYPKKPGHPPQTALEIGSDSSMIPLKGHFDPIPYRFMCPLNNSRFASNNWEAITTYRLMLCSNCPLSNYYIFGLSLTSPSHPIYRAFKRRR